MISDSSTSQCSKKFKKQKNLGKSYFKISIQRLILTFFWRGFQRVLKRFFKNYKVHNIHWKPLIFLKHCETLSGAPTYTSHDMVLKSVVSRNICSGFKWEIDLNIDAVFDWHLLSGFSRTEIFTIFGITISPLCFCIYFTHWHEWHISFSIIRFLSKVHTNF